MSVDTRLRLPGRIAPEAIAKAIREIFPDNGEDLTNASGVKEYDYGFVDTTEKEWAATADFYRDDHHWVVVHGFIDFLDKREPTYPHRKLFYSYSAMNTHENLDDYVREELADADPSTIGKPNEKPLTRMLFSETTYLNLGCFGKSVDIMLRLIAYFGGGWLDKNDCDDYEFEWVSAEDALRQLPSSDGYELPSKVKETLRNESAAAHWGFTTEQLLDIGKAHAKARMLNQTETMASIEYRLEDCNFHTDCELLIKGEYDLYAFNVLLDDFQEFVVKATDGSGEALTSDEKKGIEIALANEDLVFSDDDIRLYAEVMRTAIAGKAELTKHDLLVKQRTYVAINAKLLPKVLS